MPDLTAKRTLVKSPPELWEELSEVEGLAKHLGAFGEIKITKLEPEHTVAWEGDHASGTVSIEPSGWGTKVTLHAELPEAAAPEAEEPQAEEPAADEPPAEGPAAEEPGAEEPIAVAEEPIAVAEEPVAEGPVALEPAPVAEEPEPARERRGFWAWLFRTRTGTPEVEPEPEPVAAEPEHEPVAAEPEPEPVAVEPESIAVEPEPEPEPVVAEPEHEGSDPLDEAEADERDDPGGLTPADEDAEPAVDPERARAILDEALDALGAAHHRPFSRG
jgi:hypothetical protein